MRTLLMVAMATVIAGCAGAPRYALPIPAVEGRAVPLFSLSAIDLTVGTGTPLTSGRCVYAHYTGWTTDGKKFALNYTLNGKALSVKYVANEDGTWTFTYSRPDGTPVVETYKPNERGPGGGGAKGEGKFARQNGRKGQYGHVVMERQPREPGSGIVFANKIVGGIVPM